jgi:hypothetical protein
VNGRCHWRDRRAQDKREIRNILSIPLKARHVFEIILGACRLAARREGRVERHEYVEGRKHD